MNRKIVRERADGIRSRQTILDAAAKLATVEGLNGLSIGNLAEHIGMSKSGLYAHFRSKEELQLATIETAREIFDAVVVNPTLSLADPLDQLEALCNRFLDYVERRVFPGGCFFAAVAAEFDMRPGPVKAGITKVIDGWIDLLRQRCREAKELSLISPMEDTEQLAFELHSYLLMGNMSFVLHNEALALQRARKAVRSRLTCASDIVATPAPRD